MVVAGDLKAGELLEYLVEEVLPHAQLDGGSSCAKGHARERDSVDEVVLGETLTAWSTSRNRSTGAIVSSMACKYRWVSQWLASSSSTQAGSLTPISRTGNSNSTSWRSSRISASVISKQLTGQTVTP